MAFGLLVQNIGLNFLWAGLISLTVYAGSIQFVMINFLSGASSLIEVALVTFVVNMRHMFYGLTFITRFKNMGRKKSYMIFALTDETYALLCSAKVPTGIDSGLFYFCIALLNQIYWVTGTLLGAIFGSILSIDTTGIEFTMTALFAVICTEQWLSFPTRIPALIGLICAVLALNLFGITNMLIPAMFVIILLLTLLRPALEPKIKKLEEEEMKQCQL
jgi:4-azaleucine resistance transporter AzlC